MFESPFDPLQTSPAAGIACGALTMAGLLDLLLVQMYLHTMTNGVLIGDDTSTMSVLEKRLRTSVRS